MIDEKYTGVITKADGTVVDDFIVFRAKDAAVPAMLDAYMDECKAIGADNFHLETIEKLRDRVCQYQKDNPHLVKVPDTTEEDLIFDASRGGE